MNIKIPEQWLRSRLHLEEGQEIGAGNPLAFEAWLAAVSAVGCHANGESKDTEAPSKDPSKQQAANAPTSA